MWIASGIGILLATAVLIRSPDNVGGALGIAAAFVILPLASGLVGWHRLSKIGSVPPGTPPEVALAFEPALATPSGTDAENDSKFSMKP